MNLSRDTVKLIGRFSSGHNDQPGVSGKMKIHETFNHHYVADISKADGRDGSFALIQVTLDLPA